jgi:hypothetical protein
MIRYYRTTPEPHYVKATSLEFGDKLPSNGPEERPAHRRQTLQPGSCDGDHPEYTEAFDIAGLRAAAEMAEACDAESDARQWRTLADDLLRSYAERFGERLAKDYGSFCVLWPCRLCALDQGTIQEQFRGNGATRPGGWRYFDLARPHQGLLAGNREAGWKTIDSHLDHPQMQGWYLFDEGGRSGPGGWRFARTTWNPGVAMPHGWAVAEMWLLLRDCFAFEDGDRLVLAAGLPESWLRHPDGVSVEGLPTHFGKVTFHWQPTAEGATLNIAGDCSPPAGYRLRLPEGLVRHATIDGADQNPRPAGELDIPRVAREVRLRFAQ